MTGPFCSFFGLRDNPFRANPDPRYLFLTAAAQHSIEQILEGIRARKGLLLLTGEVGTGKTVLIHRLLERLAQEGAPRAFIFNSHLNVSELFELILAEFGITFVAQRGTPRAHLNSWLQDRFRAGQTPVLFVDEAQGLPWHVLEELRLLLNLHSAQGNLLQIVLSGQPEFEQTLRRPELRQIRQRVALRCRTLPLTLEETEAYIQSRLRFAGALDASTIFQPEVVQTLFLYSRGIARVLNLLCEQSLMRAANGNIRPVPGRFVAEAAQEFQYDAGRTFLPRTDSDQEMFSGLFAPRPVFVETPEIAPTASAEIDTGSDVNGTISPTVPALPLAAAAAFGIRSRPLSSGTQLARLPMSGYLPSSATPIMFPSLSRRPGQVAPPTETAGSEGRLATGTPAEQLIAELSTVSNELAPFPGTQKKVSDRPQQDLRKHLKHNSASLAIQRRVLSASIKSKALTLLNRLRRAVASGQAAISEQLHGWRKGIMHAVVSPDLPGFADSWLKWLRAPSGSAQRRRPTAKSRGTVRAASSPVAPGSLSVNSSQSPRSGSRCRFTHLMSRSTQRQPLNNPPIRSILNWLQQPAGTLRSRVGNRSANSRIA